MIPKSRPKRLPGLCPGVILVFIVSASSALLGETPPPLSPEEIQRQIKACIEKMSNLSFSIGAASACSDTILSNWPHEALGPYVQAVKNAQDSRVQMRLLKFVDRILLEKPIEGPEDGAKILPSLKELLSAKEFSTRYWAVKVMGGIPNEEALNALNKVMEEPDDKKVLHVQAIYSMGRTGLGDVPLAKYIRNRDALIREAVCDALLNYRSVAALTSLFRGLYDKDVRVRTAAIEGFKAVNSDKDFSYYAQAAEEERLGPLKAWYDWMLNLGDVKFRPEELTEFFDSPNAQIRENICRALKEKKSATAFRCLLWGLIDGKTPVRQAAIESLKLLHKGNDFGFNPTDSEENREKAVQRWLDSMKGQKIPELEKLDWLPVFQASPPQTKAAILEFLKGVKTRSAGLCIYWGVADTKSVEVRRKALETFKVLSGGADLGVNVEAKAEEILLEAQKVSNWLAEHKQDLQAQ